MTAQIRVLTAFDLCSSQYPYYDYSYVQYNSTNFLVLYYASVNGTCGNGLLGYSSYAYLPECAQISLSDDYYYGYYYYGNNTNSTNSTNSTDDSYYYSNGYYFYYDYWDPRYNMSYIYESFPAAGGSAPYTACSNDEKISYGGAGELTIFLFISA